METVSIAKGGDFAPSKRGVIFFLNRIDKVLDKTEKKGIDYFIAVNHEGSNSTVRYLSGFSGDTACVVVGRDERYIMVDSRFYTQASKETDFEMVRLGSSALEDKMIELLEGKKIGVEPSKLSYSMYMGLSSHMTFVDFEEELDGIRAEKDDEEVSKIRKAIEIAQNALAKTLEKFRVGMTEREFAAALEYEMVMNGAQKPSFDTIIASGYRDALPHGLATEKRIESGETIVVDFGALYEGYCSDLTRTFAVGKVDDKIAEAYSAVLEAQTKAMSSASSGMSGREIDSVARTILNEKGYGDYFGHGLGHGLGMDVHESPFLSPKYDREINENVVITFEPGVYVPGEFGIRIEDDVLLTKGGHQCLSSFNKEFTRI